MLARTAAAFVLLSLLALACTDAEETAPGGATTTGAGGAGGTGGAGGGEPWPSAVADHTFGPFEAWAAPIEDYKAIGEAELPGDYDPGIGELQPFGGRLWMGYGDGTYNMGTYTPIELRSFSSPDDPVATAAVVDGAGQGAEQDVPTRSGEEVIDRYRTIDGALWQAGLDSIDADELWTQANTDPKGIEGNAYVLEGDVWKKHRSIVGGEHVHDLAGWQGAVYGVGSGADLRSEFEAGQIFRYLWRSDDGGVTFATVERIQHPDPGNGDTRWIALLSTTARLYAFGYESDFSTNSASVRNAAFEGGAATTALDASDPLQDVYAFGTLPLPGGAGLVWGVDVAASPLRYGLWHVAPEGTAKSIALGGRRVLDLSFVEPTEELLALLAPGDEYPGEDPATWELAVAVAPAASPETWTDLASYEAPVGLRAIAFWEHALLAGTADGQVLKAASIASP